MGTAAEEQAARIDIRLEAVAQALREARAENETANIAICQQRYDELLDEKLLIPGQRPPSE